jgi:hypothetical protein
MPYRQVLNSAQSISVSDRSQIAREFDDLRAELDNMRTRHAALLAKLDADAGVTDTNYAATLAYAAPAFKAVS